MRERSSTLVYRMSITGKYLLDNPSSYDLAQLLVVPDGGLDPFPVVTTHVCLN